MKKNKRQVNQIVRVAKPVEVDEDDLITASDAAKLLQTGVSTVTRMMDSGRIPEYAEKDGGFRVQRYTSRKALQHVVEIKMRPARGLFI